MVCVYMYAYCVLHYSVCIQNYISYTDIVYVIYYITLHIHTVDSTCYTTHCIYHSCMVHRALHVVYHIICRILDAINYLPYVIYSILHSMYFEQYPIYDI